MGLNGFRKISRNFSVYLVIDHEFYNKIVNALGTIFESTQVEQHQINIETIKRNIFFLRFWRILFSRLFQCRLIFFDLNRGHWFLTQIFENRALSYILLQWGHLYPYSFSFSLMKFFNSRLLVFQTNKKITSVVFLFVRTVHQTCFPSILRKFTVAIFYLIFY